MLDFIKKFLKKKEKPKESVPLNKLDGWYEEKKKRILDRFSSQLKIINDKIIAEIEKAGENIVALEKARLKNPKITVREKQFMEGNRDIYIKKSKIFLKQIELPKEINSVNDFLQDFNRNIEGFGKSTAKPYRILQEFFANEAAKISTNVGNVGRAVKELKEKYEEIRLESLNDIKEKIKKINLDVERKKKTENDLTRRTKGLRDLNKEIDDLQKELRDLEESNEYKNLLKLKKDGEEVVNELDSHKELLNHSFSILERALKKYAKIAFEDEKLVISYLENPVLALRKDSELKILGILSNIDASVNNNTIDLKESKRKKTIEVIRYMDKSYFENFLSKYDNLNGRISDIDKKIKTNKIEQKKESVENDLRKNKEEKEKLEQSIENIRKKIEKINIEKEKKKNEDEIRKIMDIELIIS